MDELVERAMQKTIDRLHREQADMRSKLVEQAAEIRSLRTQVEQARRASLSIAWPMNEVGAWTQAVANAAVQQIERHEENNNA